MMSTTSTRPTGAMNRDELTSNGVEVGVTYWLPIAYRWDFEHLDDARIYAHHLHRIGEASAPITIRAYDPDTCQSADVESFIPAAF